MRKRWPAAAVCAAQAALSFAMALRACGSCGRGAGWAWAGAAFYAALTAVVLAPRAASLAGLAAQWALAVHACLVAAMIRSGVGCLPCLAGAAMAVGLWLLWRPLDPRPPLRCALEFATLLLLAAAVVRPGAPTPLPPAEGTELVIFEDPDCPHCLELAARLPDLSARHPDVAVRRLPAAEFPFVQGVPTILVRGPGGRRLFEGLPEPRALDEAIQSVRASR
ncbi:MAG TPA: hypothetical protein VI643_03635 [Planctomycetota bacterium]|nr:hypothetical protein [Planctomycetota bacterium]